jgi:hypothetical protein
MAFDAAGHYNRPDIFSVQIDERRREQFTTLPVKADEPVGKKNP